MKSVRSWIVVAGIFLRYFLYKVNLAAPPTRDRKLSSILNVVGAFCGWNRYIRIENADLCPKDHPAIFYGNHHKLDDPLYLFNAITLATGGEPELHAMLRNDFFQGTLLKTRFLDLDELLDFLGAHGISRDKVSLKQIKIFLDILREGKSFMLYPGRRRSCSGMLMDYRDNVETPGGISFFLHAIQARNADVKVSAVPSSRNYNPITRHTSVIFGPEQFLERGASREEQRAFDQRLIEVMGGLVEVNASQVLAALLFTRCLHGMTAPISAADLQDLVRGIMQQTRHPYVDPEDLADVPHVVDRALRYFKKHGMLDRKDGKVTPKVEAILSLPELTTKYRRENPVKYLTNQNLHLGDVTALVEQKVLGLPRLDHAGPPLPAQNAS